jgi:hypothetical protein
MLACMDKLEHELIFKRRISAKDSRRFHKLRPVADDNFDFHNTPWSAVLRTALGYLQFFSRVYFKLDDSN